MDYNVPRATACLVLHLPIRCPFPDCGLREPPSYVRAEVRDEQLPARGVLVDLMRVRALLPLLIRACPLEMDDSALRCDQVRRLVREGYRCEVPGRILGMRSNFSRHVGR